MEFAGCVYADPRSCSREVQWAESDDGRKYPVDLTRAELAAMDLVGLPVRIEHQARPEHAAIYNNEVGRVTGCRVDPATGKTDVTYTLHDNPAGHTAKTLTKLGTIRELSLHHRFFPDTGAVEPVEISLCEKGARNGTCIYKGLSDCGNKVTQETPPPISAKMSAATVAPPSAEGNNASDKPQVAAEASEAPKEAAPAKPAAPVQLSHVEFLETIGSHIKDPQLTKELFDRYGKVMQFGAKQGETAKNLQVKLDALEEANTKIRENNAVSAEQMIAVMNDMYRKWSPSTVMTEDCAKEASQVLVDNPSLMDAFRGVPIMASAITQSSVKREKSEAQEENNLLHTQLQKSKASLAMYEQQITAMNGNAELWQTPAYAPPLQQQQPIAVECSAGTKRLRTGAPDAGGLVPAWLRESCGQYEGDSFQQQKIHSNDFTNPDRITRTA